MRYFNLHVQVESVKLLTSQSMGKPANSTSSNGNGSHTKIHLKFVSDLENTFSSDPNKRANSSLANCPSQVLRDKTKLIRTSSRKTHLYFEIANGWCSRWKHNTMPATMAAQHARAQALLKGSTHHNALLRLAASFQLMFLPRLWMHWGQLKPLPNHYSSKLKALLSSASPKLLPVECIWLEKQRIIQSL